jgi:hypothetical protein
MSRLRYTTVLLILTALLPILALCKPGLPVTHDGQDHVARIANFYQSFSEGNIVPRWAANLNWGYGHPVLMFLYPLPSYVASFFHFIGFSFVDSTKLVFGISFIASVLFMYLFLRDSHGVLPAAAGAFLYGFAPYRFVDLYVRGALGEHVAFVFPPLILWGLYGLSQKRSISRWGLLTTVATFGLLLSHNAISLMIFPLVSLYVLYLWFFITKKSTRFLISSLISLLFGFLWSAFFWIPAYFEGKYTLRDIVTRGEIPGRTVPFFRFLYSPWNYGGGNEFTKQIGFAGWLVFAVSLFSFYKRPKIRLILGVFILLFIGTLLMMTDLSLPVWNTITLLQKFQFPWRFLTITTVLIPLIAAYVFTIFSERKQSFFLIIIIIISVLTTANMWQPKGYKTYNESFFTGIYNSTTDTGESSPIWSVRFMEYRPSAHIGVITGQAFIIEQKRTTTEHNYVIKASEQTRLLENTLYFPGWKVMLDKKEIVAEFQDPQYRGLLTFSVPPGNHSLQILFENTRLRSVAEIISGISILVFFVGYSFIGKRTI